MYMHSKKQLNTLIKSLESNYTNIQLIILEDNWKEKIKRYIKFNFVREYIIIMDKKSA
jgi:vacuolar-type H+-ATPase subunit F/Vma7